MVLDCRKRERINRILQYCYPVLLFIYSFRHIRVGAEWWDTGYNYANFTYMDRMDDMWLFSTYLGNVAGHFMTGLPFGNTMVGMQFYTGLVVALLAVFAYVFFVKEVKLPAVLAFLGEFLALSLCWCPTAVLYNYLSYVLLAGGMVLLYFALTREKKEKLYFVLAGICLGINVFVRFANLTNMALIVAVWAMGIIRKNKPVEVIGQTLWCVLGYALGLLGMFGVISIRYGATNYIQGVLRLLSMPQEASSYTLYSMIYYQIVNYQQNLIWLGYLATFMVLGMVVYQILPQILTPMKNIGYIGCVLCSFYVLMNQRMFNMKYSTKMSVFQWAVMILTATLIGGIIVILGKRFSQRDKLLCGLGIIVMIITPLGSNNHLYLSINNLFFIAPFTLWLLYRFFKYLPQAWNVKGWKIWTFPIKGMLFCIFAMILFQGTMFGWGYVFSETNGGENLHTRITDNEVLEGMLTDEERANMIQEISVYVSQQNLTGKEVILYGDIPALSYYLRMPFAISPWPDLASYNYSIMKEDLQEIEEQVAKGDRELPVILMNKHQGVYAKSGRTGLQELGNVEEHVIEKLQEDKKLQLMMTLIDKYDYHVTFENDKFVLFLAHTEGEK